MIFSSCLQSSNTIVVDKLSKQLIIKDWEDINMLNYFLFGWMFDWMDSLLSDLPQTGRFIAAIISLCFLIGLILIVKKHEKEYK